jgi:hypothetical protein
MNIPIAMPFMIFHFLSIISYDTAVTEYYFKIPMVTHVYCAKPSTK